ncbi:MAG: hypothetical protein OHK0046_22030 [Anaerolineae bacterium]
MKRSMTFFLVFIAVLAAVVPAVLAQEATPTATPEAEATEEILPTGEDMTEAEDDVLQGYVRFMHFAPDVGAVDLYINGELSSIQALDYPEVSNWISVPAGQHALRVNAAGSEEALLTVDDFSVTAGDALNVAVTLNADNTPRIITARQQFEPLLPSTAYITFFNALSGDGAFVNFSRDDVVFVTELGTDDNVNALSLRVDAGTFTFSVNETNMPDNLMGEAADVDITDSYAYLIAVVGTPDNPQIIVNETTRARSQILTDELAEPGNLAQAIQGVEGGNTYYNAFVLSALTGTLESEGPYTVFLPAAFLTDEFSDALQDDTDALAALLRDHIVEGNLKSRDLRNVDSLTTLQGHVYPVVAQDNGIFIGDAQVLEVNIPATNGTIHIIDEILMPGSGEGEQ